MAISLEARSMTEAGGRLAKKRVLVTGAGTGIGRDRP
jgi:FlaA1/EpsC-like NDP-sugar epimerase